MVFFLGEICSNYSSLVSHVQSYCMDIHGYIFVYSINNAKSFEVCKVIHDKLMDLVGHVQVPIVLVGNKRLERDEYRKTELFY